MRSGNGADPSGTTRRLALALALVATAAAIVGLVQRFAYVEPGIDFYHLWGIAAADRLAPEGLASPYAEPEPYEQALLRAAAASDDAHFQRAVAERRERGFQPTGTPLFYASFGLLPDDYTTAHALYRALQLAAFVAAVMLLLGLLGVPWPWAWLAAGVLATDFNPFLFDAGVGNVSTLQLLFVVLFLGLATRTPERATRATAVALWAALGWFVLFKPNFALLAAALALCLLARHGLRTALAGAGVALGLAALLVVWSAQRFGGFDVWGDWYRYLVSGAEAKLVSYPVILGNLSSPAVAAGMFSGARPTEAPDPYPWMIGIGVLLAASAALALKRRARASDLRTALVDALADPFLAASAGVLATFALAPMVWTHYQVLVLVPAFWLLAAPRRPRGTTVLVALALAVFSGGLATLLQETIRHFRLTGLVPWVAPIRSFAWLPLWIPLLAILADRAADSAEPATESRPDP